MASFPRIDRPCPLRFDRMPGAGGFDCSHCQRHVHNLSAMSESAREEFLAGCDDSVCVAYTVPRSHPQATAAWVMAATVGVMSTAAMAQSNPPATLDQALAAMRAGSGENATAQAQGLGGMEMITVGGVSNPRSAERADFAIGPRAPELPIVVDDTDAPAANASSAQDAKAGSG